MAGSEPVDDPVATVQAFCNVMARSNSELEAARASLEGYTERLHEAQAAADERFNLLSESLHAFVSEAESAAEGALGDVDELGTTAHGVANARLTATGQGIDSVEDRLTHALQEGSQALQGGHDDLARDGFDASETALKTIDGDLDALDSAVAEAFDDLREGLESRVRELEAAGHAAGQALAAASAEVEQAEQAIAQSLTTAAESWDSELVSIVQDAGPDLVAAPIGTYADFQQTAEQQGEALADQVGQEARDAAECLTNEAREQVQTLYEQSALPALEALEAALSSTQKALEEGEGTCQKLESMMRDLALVKVKVGEVEQVLQAMD